MQNDVTHAVRFDTSYRPNKNPDDKIKKHSRTSPDLQLKLALTKQKKDLEWTMNEIKNHLEKKQIKKIEKTLNINVQVYFRIREKKLYAAKPCTVLLNFLFRRDQNHHSNFKSKITQM